MKKTIVILISILLFIFNSTSDVKIDKIALINIEQVMLEVFSGSSRVINEIKAEREDLQNKLDKMKDNIMKLEELKLKEKDAPFADITWMGYTGKNIPREIKEAFKLVIGAREEAIRFLRENLKGKRLPKSIEVEKSARRYLNKFGVEKFFTHGVGHSLGFSQDHGTYFRFSRKTKSRMKLNVPFTIEPGLYFNRPGWKGTETSLFHCVEIAKQCCSDRYT